MFFFFSSRRRHTRSLRDWSSDVCSSDLLPIPGGTVTHPLATAPVHVGWSASARVRLGLRSEERRVGKECRYRWRPDHLKKKKRQNKQDGYFAGLEHLTNNYRNESASY